MTGAWIVRVEKGTRRRLYLTAQGELSHIAADAMLIDALDEAKRRAGKIIPWTGEIVRVVARVRQAMPAAREAA